MPDRYCDRVYPPGPPRAHTRSDDDRGDYRERRYPQSSEGSSQLAGDHPDLWGRSRQSSQRGHLGDDAYYEEKERQRRREASVGAGTPLGTTTGSTHEPPRTAEGKSWH